MKTSELIRLLKKHGVKFAHHRGNHDFYYSPISEQYVMIWRHAKEVPIGTANQILKDAGLK